MLEKTVPLLILFLIGFGLKQVGMLRKEEGKIIGTLLMHVIIPTAILTSIAHAQMTPRLGLVLLAGTATQVILLALGFALAPLLDLGESRGAFLLSFPTLEIGTIGLAAMSVTFGATGVTLLALFDLGTAVFGSLAIPLLASLLSQQRAHHSQRITGEQVRSALKQALSMPLLWAFVGGVLVNLLHVHVSLVENVLDSIANSTLFVTLLFVGMEFEWTGSVFGQPALTMYLKLMVGLSVGALVAFVLHLGGTERIAVMVAASLPASLMTVPLAQEHHLDAAFIAQQLALALPTSLLVCFVVLLAPH